MAESLESCDRIDPLGLPHGWRAVPLGNLLRLTSGLSRPAKLTNNPTQHCPFPVYGGNGVLGYSAEYMTSEPTLVIGRVGEKCGCVHTVPAKSWISDNALYAKEFLQRVELDFIAFAVSQLDLNRLKRKSSQPLVTQGIIYSQVIGIPGLEEQRAIAHVLRTVQRAKEATEKIVAATRQLKASLMRHLFTYGPVPVDRAERVELKETEIGLVPESWRVVDLGDAISETQYGLSKRGETSGAFPILRMNNLNGGRISAVDLQFVNLDDDDFRKYKLNRGDLLFNRTNSFELVGKTSLFDLEDDFVFASYLIRVVPHPDRLDPAFSNYYLNAGITQARLKGLATRAVSQSNINATKLRGLRIPLPSLEVQREIAASLQAVDRKLESEEARKKGLDALFSTLLHHLTTGKLRVRDLDTTDHSHDGTAGG